MSTHIDKVSKKCHGLLGALARASPVLTEKLLKMAYVALVRTHLEYASTLLSMASDTQLHKIDVIQKAAARIITRSPRLAHSEPLLNKLELKSLTERREQHVINIVNSILDNRCHPALMNMFTRTDNTIATDFNPRTAAGKKCFQNLAVSIYNRRMLTDT
jgi:hypothetical protein